MINLLFVQLYLGAKIVIFLYIQVVLTKKETRKPPFLSIDVRKTYFTMNFMVFSKPLAFTVTK